MTLLERLNTTDRFAKSIGAQLTEVSEGYAKAEMKVEERHLNGGGVCQGGAIYTLADLSFAAVSNSHGILTLGIANNITFLKSAQLGDLLIAECFETFNHHKLPYSDIKVTNQHGELIAVMTGLSYRKRQEMDVDSLM
jgi:acyl-CoA thioesterase